MHTKMTRWGIGPLFAALSIVYAAILEALSLACAPLFDITWPPRTVLTGLGSALIIVGIPLWLWATVAVMRAYNSGTLVTRGIYRCCRHPLYAAWIVLIGPGIALLSHSWLLLSAPPWMYAVARVLVVREEVSLETLFGGRYRAYRKSVPCLMPYGCLKSRRRTAPGACAD